jgi:aspartate/methionine/tyrosine aminotransferase
LINAHVSVAPGAIYGPGGTQYVRFSVGVPDDRLDEALDRLQRWYGKR